MSQVWYILIIISTAVGVPRGVCYPQPPGLSVNSKGPGLEGLRGWAVSRGVKIEVVFVLLSFLTYTYNTICNSFITFEHIETRVGQTDHTTDHTKDQPTCCHIELFFKAKNMILSVPNYQNIFKQNKFAFLCHATCHTPVKL